MIIIIGEKYMILSSKFWQRKTALFIVILFLFSIFSTVPPTIGADSGGVMTEEDGTFLMKNFSDITHDMISGCEISESGNKLFLERIDEKKEDFNFKDWDDDSPHTAYRGGSFWFFQTLQLFIISNLFENEVTENTYYNLMSEDDEDNEEVYPPVKDLKPNQQQWHHFHFKIAEDLDDETPFNITWIGNAEDFKSITLYAWKPINFGLGRWQQLSRNTSFVDGKKRVEFRNTNKDITLDDKGYLDLLVVVVPAKGETSYLQTNFVNVQIQSEGFKTQGTVQFNAVNPDDVNISHWERFIWSGYEKEGTSISFKFYDEDDDTYTYDGDNRIVDISSIDPSANLTVNVTLKGTLTASPELYDWGLCWQKEDNEWSDDFSSDFRIDERSSTVYVDDSEVHLYSTVNDWPMFGQNPSNTRVSPGFGPGTLLDTLCWISEERVGGDFKNPIVHGGNLYVVNSSSEKIYKYNLQNVEEFNQEAVAELKIQAYNESGFLEIKNSPAATNDGDIIVATGSSGVGGGIENEVVRFSSNFNDGQDSFQRFYISDDNQDFETTSICYDASPVVKDDKVFITSWSGDSSVLDDVSDLLNLSRGNNKLICLTDEMAYEWSTDLSAGSFSTPAVGEELVVAGCEKINGDSLFAFTLNGVKEWSVDVGPIGHASPVIVDDTVYVVSKNITQNLVTAYTQVVAVNLANGEIKWSRNIGDNFAELYMNAAYSSPLAYNDFIYVMSPDGLLYKLYEENGTNAVSPKQVYNKGVVSSAIVTSSPSLADGIIYLGTPDGYIHAINADTFDTIRKKQTDPVKSIVSSPILVDGFVYYIDEDGVLYCRGERDTGEGNQITGHIVSMPIELPDDKYWYKFIVDDSEVTARSITYSILDEDGDTLVEDIEDNVEIYNKIPDAEDVDTIRLKAEFEEEVDTEAVVSLDSWKVTFTDDEPDPDEETSFSDFTKNMTDPPTFSIEAEDADGLNNSTARFELEYSNETNGSDTVEWHPVNVTWIDDPDSLEIFVNMSYVDVVDEIDIYHRIRFKIDDRIGNTAFSEWYTIQQVPDEDPPEFYRDTFTPDPPYISTMTPTCTIKAKDVGSNGNTSGINVSSAEFTINYSEDGSKKTFAQKAVCTGTNGTTSRVTITADISDSDVADDITTLDSIRFSIHDVDGNSNQSSWIELLFDGTPPTSSITNSDEIPLRSNDSSIEITSSAIDVETEGEYVSGVKEIGLYYRLVDETEWSLFDSVCSQNNCSWDFTIGPGEGGEYEFCTLAVDNASNNESFPTEGELFVTYDPNDPMVSFPDDIIVFNKSGVIPSFDQVTFTDDYELYQIYYRLGSDGIDNWTLITTTDEKEITPEWTITDGQWNDMIEDELSYVYFKVVDSLGNKLTLSSTDDAMKIKKDVEEVTNFTLDLNDFSSWQWDNSYKIRVNTQDTTISSMTLWYRFAGEDENTTMNWTRYDKALNTSPYEWDFNPEDGDGYYQFYVEATTASGVTQSSPVETQYISTFPIVELVIALVLTMVLFAVSGLVIKKYRLKDKKKKLL